MSSISIAYTFDIFVWPDGTWCYPENIEEYSHMSDDYARVNVDKTIDEAVEKHINQSYTKKDES